MTPDDTTTNESSACCSFCRAELSATRSAIYCSRRCRQAAWRLRHRRELDALVHDEPRLFAYADPPYPGLSRRYYKSDAAFAGEVDHDRLVALLRSGAYAGWALSTSARALRDVLPLCPPDARVCAWVKPIGVSGKTRGLHNAWEPLVVWGGRQLRPGRRDWLRAQPARFGDSDLMGRKPLAFCGFLFDALGMLPGDRLDDLFPGSGIVGRSWDELSRAQAAAPFDPSPTTPDATDHLEDSPPCSA